MLYHKSVLTNEVLFYLDPQPNKVYIDATFGGGGHTRAILEKEPNCKVIAFDWDQNALDKNGDPLLEQYPNNLELIWGNFSHMSSLLKKYKINSIDGILADFGTSQFQISNLPGFSFNKESRLDMRMSPGHFKTTAYDIINKSTQKELADIFFKYGEEYKAKKIALDIVNYRKERGKIYDAKQLAEIISKSIGRTNKKIHPATKVFQALRIVVNDELNNINSLLTQSINLLNPEGRLVCISFHSLEDRLVKQFFKQHTDQLETLTPKAVTATPEELLLNPSARSAKLRAAKKSNFNK